MGLDNLPWRVTRAESRPEHANRPQSPRQQMHDALRWKQHAAVQGMAVTSSSAFNSKKPGSAAPIFAPLYRDQLSFLRGRQQSHRRFVTTCIDFLRIISCWRNAVTIFSKQLVSQTYPSAAAGSRAVAAAPVDRVALTFDMRSCDSAAKPQNTAVSKSHRPGRPCEVLGQPVRR